AANTAMALLGAAWIPMWFYLNLYLQQVLGLGAFESGAALLPMTIAIMILMVGVTGRLIGRTGFKRLLVVGLVVLAAGMVLFAGVPVGGSFGRDVLGPSLLVAVGMSLSYIPALIASLSGAAPEESGLAAGLVNTSYQVGSAIGLAVVTAVALGVGDGTSIGALNDGYRAGFLTAAAIAAAAALVAIFAIHDPRAAVSTEAADAAPEQQAA
ncbi:MAG: MFS transporter, partial [Byssovorax sp.]